MVIPTQIAEDTVRQVLATVADPEIPAVSVLDLGIIEDVVVSGNRVSVTCLPTFVGCPALEVIREDIEAALRDIGAEPEVRFVYDPPWTSDRITPAGLEKLHAYGLAPPPTRGSSVELVLLSSGNCPYCGSSNTVLESPFGPTACRSTCYCRSCRNPYERFKDV